ncbi:MAG: RloB family protein [Methanosarcina sp.]
MARKPGNKSINSAWIFCEGKTEYNYFAQLKAVERISGLQLRPIICEDKNIVKLLEYSINYQKHHAKDFIKGDSIFYVFDRDANTNDDFKQAEKIVNNLSQLIISNPCFEYWILCHFELYYEPVNPQLLKLKLRKHMGTYKKNNPNIYNDTKNKIETAKKHSRKIHQMHINKNDKILRTESNPFTLIFQLIELTQQYRGN